jgi:polysaccharide chain length determinant protein (PEP-CTERM system associated)
MEEEQQLSVAHIITVFKRRFWWLIVPALIGPLLTVGITFGLRPVYTSKAFVLIEQPKIPDKFVTQVITDQLDARLMTLQEQILSRSRLEPIIERLGLFKNRSGRMTMEEKVELLRQSIDVKMISPEGTNRVPSGFYITAKADSGRTAQQVCSEILSMFMAENLKVRQQRAEGTTEFLSQQLEESKRKLDEHDAKLAAFKERYFGKLPTDEQRNLEMLNATRTRLEALNQELSQAQQQKIIQESALSQMTSKTTSPSAGDPNDLEKELSALQSQLASLQSRYTDSHPDVRKTKAQIQVLQSQLRSASETRTSNTVQGEPTVETPEIRQMRVALKLTEETIRSKRAEQARLGEQVSSMQARLQLSPVVEEQYKALTRDYESALQFYNELLGKKTQSEMSTDLERREEGEQFGVMDAPDLPAKPTFPDRVKFGLGGFAAGLALGIGMVLFIEHRENFIRTEEDVVRVLGLAVLISLPEVDTAQQGHSAVPPLLGRNKHELAGERQQAKV